MKRETRRIGFVLLMLMAVSIWAQGATKARTVDHDKLSPEFRGSLPNSQLDVIVQYRQRPTAQQYARVARLGGIKKGQLHVIRGAAFRLSGGAISQLAEDPDVAYFSPNRPVWAFLSNAAPAINAPYAWGPRLRRIRHWSRGNR